MIDIKAVKEYAKESGGTPLSNERLKQIFTANPPKEGKEESELYKLRKHLEDRLADKIESHIAVSLGNYHLISAVDLAWDATINPYNLPLILYAQGRISKEFVQSTVDEFPQITKYIQKREEGIQIDLPKFLHSEINVVRSYVTRRVAAQVNKYGNLSPFFYYHPRLQTEVGRLKADAMSERADMIADQFNYHHTQEQAIRGMLLYQRQFAFVRSAWEKDYYISSDDMQRHIFREGIDWVLPHPTRVFYDIRYPAASLNSDTGCEYCGYWNIGTLGDVLHDPTFFNKDSLRFNNRQYSHFTTYSYYWNQYLTRITPPSVPQNNFTENNTRENVVYNYSVDQEDQSIFLTEFFWKINPKQLRIADYPYPVWIRLKVAGDRTVVYAEVMPSSPCAVFEFNGHDNRLFNLSVAHDIMPYQDTLTNLYNQLIETIRQDLACVGVLNTDVFPDDDASQKVLQEFRSIIQGRDLTTNRAILEVSLQKAAALGIPMDNIFKVVRQPPNHNIENIFRGIRETLNILDRMLALSPQEIGQIAPREVTATEVAAVNNTTESVYSHISKGIDAGRNAMKRIIYEAAINNISGTVELSIPKSYPESVVDAAGFEVVERGTSERKLAADRGMTIKGLFKGVVHQYAFTSRDGSERPNNPQAGAQLINLINVIQSNERVMQRIPEEKFFELINLAVRSLGTGFNINLQSDPEGPNSFSDEREIIAAMEELNNVLVEHENDIGLNKQQLAEIGQTIQLITQQLGGGQGQLPQGPEAIPAAPPQGMNIPEGAPMNSIPVGPY